MRDMMSTKDKSFDVTPPARAGRSNGSIRPPGT
jgi:hypothetical protein